GGTRSNFGMAKALVNGELSHGELQYRVTRGDILDAPEVLRGYEPVHTTDKLGRPLPTVQYRVQRGGQTVVYVVTQGEKSGPRKIVSIYRQKPEARGSEIPLSKKKEGYIGGIPTLPEPPKGGSLPRYGSRARPSVKGNRKKSIDAELKRIAKLPPHLLAKFKLDGESGCTIRSAVGIAAHRCDDRYVI